MSYNLGDAVPLVYTINAIATIALSITDPDGVITNPTPTQGGAPPAVTYTHNQPATKVGTWLARFVATGAVTDAEDIQFYVQAILGANVYTTLPELKTALSLPVADVVDDDDLQDAILVASRAIDGDCHRHFYKITEARTLRPGPDCYALRLGPYNDLISVTTLKTDTVGDGVFETTWAASDFQLLGRDGTPNVNAAPEPQPYQYIRAVAGRTFPMPAAYGRRGDLVEITGVWGWPAVPDRIRRACRMMAAEQFKLRDAPFGAIGMADLGIIRVRDNPKYLGLINDYRLVEAAVPFA